MKSIEMDTTLRKIHAAIAGNEQCAAGILARQRVALTDHGSLSYNQDRELFCLVRPRPGTRGWWYGHVLRCPDDAEGNPERVAAIVRSKILIDKPDARTLFPFVCKALSKSQQYSPPYSRNDGDVFARAGSFEGAVEKLAGMIRLFREELRQETEIDDFTATEPGQQDMRCFEIYGLGEAICLEPYSPYEPAPDPEIFLVGQPGKGH